MICHCMNALLQAALSRHIIRMNICASSRQHCFEAWRNAGYVPMTETTVDLLSVLCPGTVSYCAPELLKEGKLTKAADVYSFAMIMWEMYSGTALFRGMNSSQVGFP